jgi:hypothetical protein
MALTQSQVSRAKPPQICPARSLVDKQVQCVISTRGWPGNLHNAVLLHLYHWTTEKGIVLHLPKMVALHTARCK